MSAIADPGLASSFTLSISSFRQSPVSLGDSQILLSGPGRLARGRIRIRQLLGLNDSTGRFDLAALGTNRTAVPSKHSRFGVVDSAHSNPCHQRKLVDSCRPKPETLLITERENFWRRVMAFGNGPFTTDFERLERRRRATAAEFNG